MESQEIQNVCNFLGFEKYRHTVCQKFENQKMEKDVVRFF
jgi:hypothetical protein